MFDTPYPVSSGEKIEIVLYICKDNYQGSYVYIYYGTNGDSYNNYENEHMGLFTMEASNNSGNGTSVYSGQIPALHYYLV
jgi:hypothetical protein